MKRLAFVVAAACAHPAPSSPGAGDPVRVELEAAEASESKRQHFEARAHYERAVAAAEQRRDAKAIGYARRAFAETLATWGETEAARTQLEGAVVASPGDPIAWQMLGILRAKLGDTPGAFAALDRSKALAPRAWIPRRDLAVLHWSLGEGRTADPDPAKAAAHRAAALGEYRAMLELDLPDRLREKVQWAIGVLSHPR
jgi:tetratricopeptide (TPR) repeat protein